MKRQIKFRGFCTTCKEKIEGNLIHGVGSKSGKFFILPIQHNLAGVQHCHPLDGVEVFPDSIGQFTGLQDIKEKDIYEGDILCVPHLENTRHQVRMVIEWDNDNAEFTKYGPKNSFKIIGNIYETPELLKTTENE